ncbi:MAG: phosphotransferase [Anaerolineales bacterium]
MALEKFLDAWPQLAEGVYEPLGFGRTHWTRLVRTPAEKFILRIYSPDVSLDKIHAELALLERLQAQALPFAIPMPIANRGGQKLTTVRQEGKVQQAVLWGYIPGENADFSDQAQAVSAGKALGQLSAALNALTGEMEASTLPNPSCQQMLDDAIGLPEFFAHLADLPIEATKRKAVSDLIQQVHAQTPAWYASLPRQIIHNDFIPGNVLVEGSQVSGVVDFESHRYDLRIMDLVVPLCHWPYDLYGTGDEWPIVDALGSGFARYQTLLPEEIQTLPQLMRLRWAVNVTYFLGRTLSGSVPVNVLEMFMDGALKNERWVGKNSAALIQLASNW